MKKIIFRSKITSVFKDFTSSEKNAGLVLVFCAIASIFISNSSLGEQYTHFWHAKIGFDFFGFDMHYSVEHWINDGIMTIFFLMVGLEIERELYDGELNPIKNAILPITAAIGGMIVPAMLYTSLNFGLDTASGFGIPMGTDIAFALGILSLAGNKVPVSIKILLTAIAIIDDLGSILIIALFYGSDLHLNYLLYSLGIFAFLLLLNRLKVYSMFPYLILGIPMWFFMMQSGIHPTISGVLLAFAFPFGKNSETSPSVKLQHKLHLPVAFIILPLFTLANTAIPIRTEFISSLGDAHAMGIALGLIIGKPLGIMSAMFVILKLNIVSLPKSVKWIDLLGMGTLAGIGFTMSIFITQLAFYDEVHVQSSKLMILIASSLAGFLGLIIFSLKKHSNSLEEDEVYRDEGE